jgi:hypothetical protein
MDGCEAESPLSRPGSERFQYWRKRITGEIVPQKSRMGGTRTAGSWTPDDRRARSDIDKKQSCIQTKSAKTCGKATHSNEKRRRLSHLGYGSYLLLATTVAMPSGYRIPTICQSGLLKINS